VLTQKENPQQLSTQFVRVESIEDYKSKTKQLGASVVKDKQEISEGYYAVLEDPKKLDRDLARKVARYLFFLFLNEYIISTPKETSMILRYDMWQALA
jgi:hypothetical protein